MHFSKNSNLGCGRKTMRSLSEGKVKRTRVYPSGPSSHCSTNFVLMVLIPALWLPVNDSTAQLVSCQEKRRKCLNNLEIFHRPCCPVHNIRRRRLRVFENNDIVLSVHRCQQSCRQSHKIEEREYNIRNVINRYSHRSAKICKFL